MFSFITHGRRFGCAQQGEFVQAVTLEEAIDRGSGEGNEHGDLGVAHPQFAQFADAFLEMTSGAFGLVMRDE